MNLNARPGFADGAAIAAWAGACSSAVHFGETGDELFLQTLGVREIHAVVADDDLHIVLPDDFTGFAGPFGDDHEAV